MKAAGSNRYVDAAILLTLQDGRPSLDFTIYLNDSSNSYTARNALSGNSAFPKSCASTSSPEAMTVLPDC